MHVLREELNIEKEVNGRKAKKKYTKKISFRTN